jgi:hypothetical protein
MERIYQVQGFSDVVFTDEGCEAYGINPNDLPDFIWATYPWQVFNIAPGMVYAFDWEEVQDTDWTDAKAQGCPVITTGAYTFLGTPRSIFQTVRQQEAA